MAKGVTRERIVVAALETLDERGIDGLTVRAVAARLGVQAPALYWHVRDKQELLDEMGTEVQRRVNAAFAAWLTDGEASGSDWRHGSAAYARALRAEYLAHRDGARTFSGTRIVDPEVLRAQEPWFARWREQGVALADAVDAGELLTAFVVGFVIEEQERGQSGQDRYSLEVRDSMLGEGVPLVVAAGHLRDEPGARFERQLDIVLDGLAARLGSAASGGRQREAGTPAARRSR